MFKASPEQVKALEEENSRNSNSETHFTKQRFISDFLKFAERVTPTQGGGGGQRIGLRLHEWKSNSSSDCVKVPTEEGSPDMAAEVVAYRQGIYRRSFGKRPVHAEVSAADVRVGAATAGTFPRLVGSTVVLRVTEFPPAVYYDAEGSSLTPIEPDTPEWTQMSELVESLTSQESEVKSRYIRDK